MAEEIATNTIRKLEYKIQVSHSKKELSVVTRKERRSNERKIALYVTYKEVSDKLSE